MLRDEKQRRLRNMSGSSGNERGICMIIVDEADSVAGPRDGTSSDTDDQGTSELLQQLQGVDSDKNEGIMLWMLLNNLDGLDPALKRPSRTSRHLIFDAPDEAEDRLDILRKISERVQEDRGISVPCDDALEEISKITSGQTADYLRGIVDTAADIARRAKRNEVTREDLFEGFQRVFCGLPEPRRQGHKKRTVVISHELGHVAQTLALAESGKILQSPKLLAFSLLPRGKSLARVFIDGSHLSDPPTTRDEFFAQLLISAGGRAAELCWGTANREGLRWLTNGTGKDLETMRQLSEVIITQGLIDGSFDGLAFSDERSEKSPELNARISSLVNAAIKAAVQVLEASHLDHFKSIVYATDKLGEEEIVGPSVEAYFRGQFKTDALGRMAEISARFIEDPLSFAEEGQVSTI